MRQRGSTRGSYAPLYAIALFTVLAFATLSIDVSMLRLAANDAQDIADAASQAALLELRETSSTSDAADLAELVVQQNTVLGGRPALESIEFGTWDAGVFQSGTARPNGVRVQVGRTVDTLMARILGVYRVPVARDAISAARQVHVILVMDITNSWSQTNFANARLAAVEFYDRMAAAAGPDDRIGMVVFTGQFGVEHTPLLTFAEAQAAGVRANWNALRTASKAGMQLPNGNCNVYAGGQQNNFSSPVNGCYPNMWREYIDESGTDHANGLEMARRMFAEHEESGAYRAMLTLTDGVPNGTGAHTQRAAAGYVETRWRFFRTNVRRSTSQVQTDSIALAQTMWDDMEVHHWAVSFIQDAAFLRTAVHGDGYYTLTNSSSALVPIFEDVAESLPVAIVQ